MQDIKGAASEFLANKHMAVTGVSRMAGAPPPSQRRGRRTLALRPHLPRRSKRLGRVSRTVAAGRPGNCTATLVDFRNSTAHYPSRADLATVTVPVVCSYGARSPDTIPRDVRALAAAIPTATTQRIKGSGHAAPFDATAEYVQLIGDAIAASRRAGPRAGAGDTETVGIA